MLSIIIPTLQKNTDILYKLLQELTEDNTIGEVIIIDNSLKGLNFTSDKVKVILPKKNLYVNQAWNLGIQHIKYDYFGILNDDILLPKNYCSQIYEFLKANNNAGLIGLDSSVVDNMPIENFSSYPQNSQLVFHPMENKLYTICWGSAIFGKKENYYKIPKCLKIWCGDNYLLKKNIDNQKICYEVKNTQIKHVKSLTCNNSFFDKIKAQDVYNYSKIDKRFKQHSHYPKNLSILQKIFSITNEKKHKVFRLLGFKIKLKLDKPILHGYYTPDKKHKVINILGIKLKINSYFFNKQKIKQEWDEYFSDFLSTNKKIILVIDQDIPEFDKNAGAKSTLHIIQTYQKLNLNACFLTNKFIATEPYSQKLRNMGVKILTDINIDSLKMFNIWLKRYSKQISYVFLSRPNVGVNYIKELKKYKNIKILYYGQDLHFLREQRTYEITKDLKYLEKSKSSKKIEYEIIKNADVSYFPSVVEKDLLKKDFPAKDIEVIPVYAYATDNLPAPQKFEDRKNILFVGGVNHPPNADGLKWFVNEIFPQIVKVIPDIKLNVAGSNVTDEIRQLQSSNINILGFVSDEELQNLYKTTRVVIAPLRYGAGMKGKVVEALYNQIPIITTDIGVEGIDNLNKAITIANESNDFANKLIELYTNKDKNEYAANNSINIIKKQFSVEVMSDVLEKGLNR